MDCIIINKFTKEEVGVNNWNQAQLIKRLETCRYMLCHKIEMQYTRIYYIKVNLYYDNNKI